MGITHRRRVSGVGVNRNLDGNNLNADNQTNGITATGIKRRESAQSGKRGETQFLQGAAVDLSDSDTGSSLLDELDLHEEDRDTSDRRMRAEAKSIRKVAIPHRLPSILVLKVFTSRRLRILRSPTGL